MQVSEKLSNLSKVLQFDERIKFLFESRDHSSNQCNCVQSQTEKNRALDEENRIRFEAYQED